MRFTLSVDIARPPDEVFAYLADPSNLPAWQESAVEAHREGGPGLGARVVERRRMLGHEVESTLEVSEYEELRLLTLRTVKGPIPLEVRHALSPSGTGTRLEVAIEGEGGGMLGLARKMAVRAAERQFKGDFERLKRVLESGAS
jgi:uncharacterized protein YndB with AHSA1/START domain